MKQIKLSGKYAAGDHAYAIVDDDDYQWLSRHAWKAKPNARNNNVYAIRTTLKNGKTIDIRMHREVAGAIKDDGFDVHHINHNSLDNRRSNLQITTRKENIKEVRSKIYSGVCVYCNKPFDKEVKANVSNILYCSKKCKRLGTFKPRIPKEYSKICKWCNKEFVTIQSKQIFCSDKCRTHYKNNLKRVIYKRKCLQCGKHFESNRKHAVFCSREHARRYRYVHYNQ